MDRRRALPPPAGVLPKNLNAMKQYWENRISMFYAVKQACETHVATWTPLVPYATAHAEFLANLALIEDSTEKQELQLDGIATNKRERRDVMVDLTVAVAQAAYALATDTDDPELKAKMNYSRSDLVAGRDAVIGQRCQGVHTEANAVAGSLVAYGVTAGDLAALQTAINKYVGVLSAPRTAITIRKGATAAIEALTRANLDILNERMDKLMVGFNATAPDFHHEYFDARIIIDLGGKEEPEAPVPPTP